MDNLLGFRNVRAVGQRYRIVYKVEQEQVLVLVVGIGRRKDGDKKDIYTLSTGQKLAKGCKEGFHENYHILTMETL